MIKHVCMRKSNELLGAGEPTKMSNYGKWTMTMTQYHVIAMGDPKSRRWQLSSRIINWYNIWRFTKRHGFERETWREREATWENKKQCKMILEHWFKAQTVTFNCKKPSKQGSSSKLLRNN